MSTDASDDPLWYKDAVIYQLHVRSFFDQNDDGVGDFAGLDVEARLHRAARRQRDLAAAVLSLADARRRLRHRRLSGHQSRLRHAARFPGVRARGARTRPQDHHRARRQSHFRPASVVPGGAHGAARLGRSASSTSGAIPTSAFPRRASSSPTPSSRTGPGIRSPSQYYWHRFFSHQPDLNHNNPAVVNAVIQRHAALARSRRRRLAARRDSLSLRARRHERTRTCRRRTPS